MEGLSWINRFILITWQKIAPIILLFETIQFNNLSIYIYTFILISIIIGSLGGLNQTSLRKIIAFSSINHIGWILFALIYRKLLWLTYFTLYSFLTFTIIIIFYYLNLFYISQIYIIFINKTLLKIYFIINFLSLGGLPPFLGFAPKFIVAEAIIYINYYFLLTIFIIINLITLYFYLRISFSAFLIKSINNYWNKTYIFNNYLLFLTSLLTFLSIEGIINFYLFFYK